MRALLAVLLLSGCATMERAEDAAFRFACKDNVLLVGLFIGDDAYIAEVGRCLGDLRIIGLEKGTGT